LFATKAVSFTRINKEKTSMPSELVIIGVVILFGTWLILGERKSILENTIKELEVDTNLDLSKRIFEFRVSIILK